MKLLLTLAAGLVVLAGSAQSTTPSATATPTSAGAPSKPVDPDPVVCRAVDPPTGSLIGPHRRCLRRSEWEKMRRDARDLIDDLNHGEQQVNCTPTLQNTGC